MILYLNDRLLNVLKVGGINAGIHRQCLVHLALDADIVHHQAFAFSFQLAVNTGYGLDKVMFLQRLIDIDSVQFRDVETGEPHIDHNSDFEIRLCIFELFIQFFTILFAAQQVVQFGVIVFTSRHHHLDHFGRWQLFLLLLGKHNPFRGLFDLKPRRTTVF